MGAAGGVQEVQRWLQGSYASRAAKISAQPRPRPASRELDLSTTYNTPSVGIRQPFGCCYVDASPSKRSETNCSGTNLVRRNCFQDSASAAVHAFIYMGALPTTHTEKAPATVFFFFAPYLSIAYLHCMSAYLYSISCSA